jgi:peptidoglycan/LPS O-acetylase OafA/YrhL
MTTAEVLSRTTQHDLATASPGYRAGLDGLRAVSVSLVVAFHLGYLDGGNLGVDAFFVISGWLITWRLLAEHDRNARIGLGHFWGARVRRLMPASLTVIGLVVVLWPLLGIEVASLRRDALFATFWSSNWGTISGGGDYWARFGDVSPLTHFWSLAIEEQFYLVWPLVVLATVGVARRCRLGTRAAVSTMALVLGAASVLYMGALFDPADRTAAYMNTFARAHALLIGAAAGAFTVDRQGRLRGGGTARRLAPAAAVLALTLVAFSSERSDWLFQWGFPLFALAAVIVVVAVADGAWGRVLASPPMRWVGDRSYGIYLWHWPVIVLLDDQRTSLDGVALTLIRVAVSVALADLSYRLIEQPIRTRRRLAGRRGSVAAVLALAGIVAVTFVVVPAPRSSEALIVTLAPAPMVQALAPTSTATETTSDLPAITTDTLQPNDTPATVALAAVPASAPPTSAAPAATTAPAAPRPVRVLIVGDSTAVHLAEALVPYSQQHTDTVLAGSAAFPGCGLSAVDDGRLHVMTESDGEQSTIDLSACVSEWDTIARRVAAEGYEVVLVSVGPWDGTDIAMADGRVVSVADTDGSTMIARAYRAFVGQVEATGARVVWITPPDIDIEWDRITSPMDDPTRWQALRDIIADLPVEQVDLPAWLAATGNDGQFGRPDGVHLSEEAAIEFVRDAVVPQLVAITRG